MPKRRRRREKYCHQVGKEKKLLDLLGEGGDILNAKFARKDEREEKAKAKVAKKGDIGEKKKGKQKKAK